MLVETRSPELGKAMDEVKKANHGEKEVMTTGTVKGEIMLETTVDMQDGGEEYVKEKKKWDKLGMLTKKIIQEDTAEHRWGGKDDGEEGGKL